jgi:hypothetical protein
MIKALVLMAMGAWKLYINDQTFNHCQFFHSNRDKYGITCLLSYLFCVFEPLLKDLCQYISSSKGCCHQKARKVVAGLCMVFDTLTVWPWQLDKETSRKMRGKTVSGKAILLLCLASFLAGSLFTSRQTWKNHPSQTKQPQNIPIMPNHVNWPLDDAVTRDCDHKRVRGN